MKTPILLLSLLAASTLTAAPWTSGGPHAGYFNSISAVASNPSIVYAAGPQGVFRTDDNGATWRDVSNRLRATPFVAADPFDPDIAYAITAGFSQRTEDGGARWTAMDTGPRTNTILIDPNDSKTLYAASDCGNSFELILDGAGIRKSTDGGRTWRAVMTGIGSGGAPACINGISLDPANARHLFAKSAYNFGTWESFDGAATWTKAADPIPWREVVIDPYQPSVRYGTDGQNVLRSDDEGLHWSPQPASGIPGNPLHRWLPDLSLDPVTPRIFSATVEGLFRSGDGGKSWVLAGDVPRIGVNGVVFNPNEKTVMIATSQGVFRAPSPAFTPWTQLDVPESGVMIEQIAVDPRRSSVVYASTTDDPGTRGRIFRSLDGGMNWQQIVGRFGSRTRVAVDAGGDLWFADLDSTALQRMPLGTTEPATVDRTFTALSTIAAHPAIPGRVFAGSLGGQIYRTNDAGATWTSCQSVGSALEQLVLDPSGDTLFAASTRGTYRSTDGCATFERVDERETIAMAVAPSNPAVVYRAARDSSLQRHIWRSEDHGTTWTQAAPLPFGSLGVGTIVVDPRDAQRLWIADPDRGVWESADGGATWKNLSDSLPVDGATALAIDSGGNVLHAGVFQHGVWELRVRGRQRVVRPR